MGKITFTKIKNTAKNNRLSKRFYKEDGKVLKDGSTKLYEGHYETIEVDNITEFCEVVKKLSSSEGLIYGVFPEKKGEIITKKKFYDNVECGGFYRGKKHTSWGVGAGIFCGDFDCHGENQKLSKEELENELLKLLPSLKNHPYTITDSASGWIFDTGTNKWHTTEEGKRIYIPVSDAVDIPLLGNVFSRLSYLKGINYAVVRKNGIIDKKVFIDLAVLTPEHLDYAGAVCCENGLEKRNKKPLLRNTDKPYLNVKAIDFVLTDAEKEIIRENEQRALDAVKDEAKLMRAKWIEEHAKKVSKRTGKTLEEAKKMLVRCTSLNVLDIDLIVYFANGEEKTIFELCQAKNIEEYNYLECADPMEPEYMGGRKNVAQFRYSKGQIWIDSFAHGKSKYRLYNPIKSFWDVPSTEKEEAGLWFSLFGETIKYNRTSNAVMTYQSGKWTNHESGVIRGEKVNASEKICCGVLLDTFDKEIAKQKEELEKLKDDEEEKAKKEKEIEKLRAMKYKLKRHWDSDGLRMSIWRKIADYGVFAEDLDKENYLVCCENGVLNLRTLAMLEHSPLHLITNQVVARYDNTAKSDEWRAFLLKITSKQNEKGDWQERPEIADYLQQLAGTILCGGGTRLCHFFYGGGGNGKSTMLAVLAEILGDFAGCVSPELLCGSEDRNYEKAMIKGKRLLIAQEIDKDKTYNSTMIKALAGQDPIQAREIRGAPFVFLPTHKLIITGNNKPKINENDPAMRDRLKLVPFDYSFSVDEKIPEQEAIDKLLKERDGIFNWMVEGWIKYCENGKKLPQVADISDATETYFETHTIRDRVEQFFFESGFVKQQQNGKIKAQELYFLYSKWMGDVRGFNDDKKLSYNAFAKKLAGMKDALCLKPKHGKDGNYYVGWHEIDEKERLSEIDKNIAASLKFETDDDEQVAENNVLPFGTGRKTHKNDEGGLKRKLEGIS